MHTQPAPDVTAPRTYVVPAARRSPEARKSSGEDDAPPAGRLFTVTLWAAISIFTGLIPATRLIMVSAAQTGAGWYPITTVSLGLLGLGLITLALASIHRPHLPWYLMTIATLLLTVNVTMAYTVHSV